MATKSKPKAPKKAPPAKKAKKKKDTLLFIPEPEDQEPQPLVPRRRVLSWPCAGRSPGRSASSPLRMAPPLQLDWKAKLGGPAATSPVVSEDGVLYAADRDGGLLALDVESGEKVFRLKTDPILGASPAWPLVAQGLVPGNKVPVSSPPAVFDWHLLYGDDEGIFYCVRRGDAAVIWRKSAPLSLAARRGEAYQAPIVAGGSVYTVDGDGNLHAASARNGQTLFSRFLRGRPTGPPCLAGGRVLVATRNMYQGETCQLHAIDANSGERLWHTELPGLPGRGLATTPHGLVLVGVEHGVLALGVERGERRFRLTLPGEERLTGTLAVEGEHAWLTGERTVFALDLGAGTLAWTTPFGTAKIPALAPGPGLAFAGGVVWVAAAGNLVALDSGTGALLGKVAVKNAVVGSIVVAAGRLIVATTAGEVLAFRSTRPGA
jgi:outer membrane protein assembly factor BamB